MRRLSLKSPLDLSSRLSGLRGRIRPRTFAVVISVLAILAAFAARSARAQESSADKTGDPKIGELIGRVRAEEAKYHDLEIVTRRSHRTLPGGPIHWTVQRQEETLDAVRQTGLCYGHVQIVRTLDGGAKRTQELVSAFDGERTRTVEMGNSVNVHLGRYEPSQVVPPHSWGLAAWQVNFDLSTFVGGMAALNKDRKVRRIRYQAGTIFEFSKLDFQLEGEETVDGLRCVKIHCERWNTTRSEPTAGSVWLARDRNLICAKLQAFYGTTRESPDVESIVKEWREIGPGLWLPARIHSEWRLAGRKVGPVEWDEDFTLESAKRHPDHPAAFFRDVPVPKDLPVFTIDKQGHLADDVLLHLAPVGSPQKRLQEVLSDQVAPLKAAGIAVVGAHAMGRPPADVDRAVNVFELSFPVCIDPPAREKLLAWGPLWTQFGIRTLPAVVVIDATGHVADFGAIDAMLFKARELAHRGR